MRPKTKVQYQKRSLKERSLETRLPPIGARSQIDDSEVHYQENSKPLSLQEKIEQKHAALIETIGGRLEQNEYVYRS